MCVVVVVVVRRRGGGGEMVVVVQTVEARTCQSRRGPVVRLLVQKAAWLPVPTPN